MLSGVCGACALALHTGTPCAPCSCVAGEISTTVEEADARSQVLERRVSVEADRARRWRYVWTAINGFSTAAPIAAIPFVSRDVRTDLVVGSVSSAVSTGFTVFWPLEVEGASERLAMASGLGPCARLQVYSAVAASAADDEVKRRAWPWHVVNFGVSAALGAVLAFGFRHPLGGVITGASGFAVGEAQLLTQPVALADETSPPVTAWLLRPMAWVSARERAFVVGAVFQGPFL